MDACISSFGRSFSAGMRQTTRALGECDQF